MGSRSDWRHHGAHLARAGHQVAFVDREKAHVEAINANGLRITGPVDEFTAQATAFTPETINRQYNTILLCVKAQDTEGATQALQSHLSPNGYVVSVQNGLNELVIEKIVGRQRTVGAFINFGADYQLGPIVTFGAQSGVPTPLTARLIALIHDIEDGKRPQDVANLEALSTAYRKGGILTAMYTRCRFRPLFYGAVY